MTQLDHRWHRPGLRRRCLGRATGRVDDAQHRSPASHPPTACFVSSLRSTGNGSPGSTPTSATCTAATRSSPRCAPTPRSRRLINRIDWVSGFANEVAFVRGRRERLMGIEPTERAQYIRLILTELTRISNHLRVRLLLTRSSWAPSPRSCTPSATGSTCSTSSRASPVAASTRTSTGSAASSPPPAAEDPEERQRSICPPDSSPQSTRAMDRHRAIVRRDRQPRHRQRD